MSAPGRVTYRDILGVREYRALFLSDATSLLGDQVAAVALAVLLYQRSGSALVAALGYATAYLPWAVGGPLLSAFADRLPPRRVVVGCDVVRMLLIALAAVPGVPLPLLGLLVLSSAMLAPPFDAAVSSLNAQVLAGDRYALALSVRDTVHQGAQLVGFVGGGALVALVGSHSALALNAASFGLSAVLLRRGLTARPAALVDSARSGLLHEAVEGVRVVADDRRLLAPLLLGIAGSAYVIVPEAIAPAFAHSTGAGARTVGLVMGTVACGSVVAGLMLARLVRPTVRRQLMWPLAVLGTLPLIAVGLHPSLPVCLALFLLLGMASSYQVAANTAFAAAVPSHARGRAFGIAMTGMFGGQGLAIVAAGAAAQAFAPTTVMAGAGVLGALAVVTLRLTVGAGGRHYANRTHAPKTWPAESSSRVPADIAA